MKHSFTTFILISLSRASLQVVPPSQLEFFRLLPPFVRSLLYHLSDFFKPCDGLLNDFRLDSHDTRLDVVPVLGITYFSHLVDHEASVESLDTREDVLDTMKLRGIGSVENSSPSKLLKSFPYSLSVVNLEVVHEYYDISAVSKSETKLIKKLQEEISVEGSFLNLVIN